MLYTVIAFVFLFIAATAFAIIFYVKLEEQKANAQNAQRQLNEFAAPSELQKIGALVGADQPQKSWLTTLIDYLDQTIGLIAPGPAADTSAEVKVDEATRKVAETVTSIIKQHPELQTTDPNEYALLQVTQRLGGTLQNGKNEILARTEQLDDLQNRFDDAMAINRETQEKVLAEKEQYRLQVEKIQANYDELKTLMEQTSDEQVRDLMTKLDDERTTREEVNRQLLRTQAELRMAHDRIENILEESVWPVKPPPDVEVAAHKPDGKVILIDDQTRIVHLNIGTDDRVYRGLTFSVYDKNQPIPRDGKGKAEIEVYSIDKNVSAARILRSEPRNPVVADDIVANLIWDSSKSNTFVIAGDFDLNGDGVIDYDADSKIANLVVKWGGKVAEQITANTDFVILGTEPVIPRKPTFEEAEAYPTSMDRYERALEQLDEYRRVQEQAQALSLPILNTERFLYFIGYKTQSTKPGAF